jgi:hypothetical protein
MADGRGSPDTDATPPDVGASEIVEPAPSPPSADRRHEIANEDPNEQSPLLDGRRDRGGGDGLSGSDGVPKHSLEWKDGEGAEPSKSVWYLFMLTLSVAG